MSNQRTLPINLFYSYSHKDEDYRSSLEDALALLRRNNVIKDWSDHKILPGQNISKTIREKMEKADIILFLLSQSFIASDECMKEWNESRQLFNTGRILFRVPIILTECSWKDVLSEDDIKALPRDGVPVSAYSRQDVAWQEIYQGIKQIADEIRNNFSPKKKYLRDIERTDLVSRDHINLQDIFVFLTLSHFQSHRGADNQFLVEQITDTHQLLQEENIILHGDDMSGKTALAQHLFLTMAKEGKPVLFFDLKENHSSPNERTLQDIYNKQFNGDYYLWREQNPKTIIMDNLTSAPKSIEFVAFAKDLFEKVIVTTSSDIYNSFFRDEMRLADFKEVKIEPLTHVQQEELIRKRLALMDHEHPVTDGFVDRIEDQINSIINNRIVPRYPFYVLSIIQTFEGFIPTNLSITSYGHCYYVLIVARLIKAGIADRDEDLNMCFNFSEHLAFKIYEHNELHYGDFERINFDQFIDEYRTSYVINDSIINRLKNTEFGILSDRGSFRIPYMYYFFLGKFLSKSTQRQEAIIDHMCQYSHISANYLTLLFVIHHADDSEVIESILIHTMCTLDTIQPAHLNPNETKRFLDIVKTLQDDVLSDSDIEEEREKERQLRDLKENHEEGNHKDEIQNEEIQINDTYKILKNIEILGQVLRNRYGKLRKEQIIDIIEIISDGGLRLVNFILKDEKQIGELARYIKATEPEFNIEEIKKVLRFLSFVWTMTSIEKIVSAISHTKIKEIIRELVRKKATPAYDLIEYFTTLENSEKLTDSEKKNLDRLLKKHDDLFMQKVLSIRTQHYMNTHRSRETIEQGICSLLGIPYRHKFRRNKG